jgi:hypothetical protein
MIDILLGALAIAVWVFIGKYFFLDNKDEYLYNEPKSSCTGNCNQGRDCNCNDNCKFKGDR